MEGHLEGDLEVFFLKGLGGRLRGGLKIGLQRGLRLQTGLGRELIVKLRTGQVQEITNIVIMT